MARGCERYDWLLEDCATIQSAGFTVCPFRGDGVGALTTPTLHRSLLPITTYFFAIDLYIPLMYTPFILHKGGAMIHYWFKPPSVDTGVIACGPRRDDTMTTRDKAAVTCPACLFSWEYQRGDMLEVQRSN